MTVSSKTFPQIEREMFGSTLEHFAGAYDERDMFGVEEALRMAILFLDASGPKVRSRPTNWPTPCSKARPASPLWRSTGRS